MRNTHIPTWLAFLKYRGNRMNDNATNHGIFGTIISTTGFIVSMLPEIEASIRVAGGIISIIAGVLTCIYMTKQIMK
jgi:hypothetical protein